MLRASKYRLYPNKQQRETLQWVLDRTRELYNAALQERRDAWTMCRVSITYYQQAAQLPEIKEVRPEYNDIHSQVLQDVLRRVDKAYKAFFRRVKEGKTPGYPRFHGYERYDSFTYPQSGFSLTQDNRVYLSKIGTIKMKMPTGKKANPRKETGRPAPSSVRATTGSWCLPVRLSQRSSIIPPKKPSALTWACCTLSGLNKSILDAGWRQFQQICVNKAECAGSRVLFVSPRYTSQMCSGCGAIVQKELDQRWHACLCGCSLDRDHNAAINILRLGLQSIAKEARARTERSEDAPLRSPRL